MSTPPKPLVAHSASRASTASPPAASPGRPGDLLAPFLAVSAPLVGVFLAMLALVGVAVAGLVLDPRVITGAPAWLKPLKFAISTAIYSLSFAWAMGHVQGRPRLVRLVTRVTATALAVELALIFLQAARGTSSHFNVGTAFDSLVVSAMGSFILLLWLAQIAASLALLRQRFADPLVGFTLRAGMVLTTLGAAVGWLMVMVRPDQLGHGIPTVVGSHTIGGSDGGAGLPLVMWSSAHGDLRAAHFFGLHALQLLPILAWLVARPAWRLGAVQQLGLLRAGAGSALGLLAILVWQALRGQSVVAPDSTTLVALATWLVGTVLLSAAALMRADRLAAGGVASAALALSSAGGAQAAAPSAGVSSVIS